MLPSTAILAHFKPLQRGIAACMTCGNTKVLRAVHSLLSRLMSNFPTEPSKMLVLNHLNRSGTHQLQKTKNIWVVQGITFLWHHFVLFFWLLTLQCTESCFLFPGTSTVASKYEELECLYAAVGKVIYEGLTNYEKATSNTNTTQLFGKTFSDFYFVFLLCIYFWHLVAPQTTFTWTCLS